MTIKSNLAHSNHSPETQEVRVTGMELKGIVVNRNCRDTSKIELVVVQMANLIHGPVSFPGKGKKLQEEVAELLAELPNDLRNSVDVTRIFDELGDVAFIITHIAHHYGFTLFDLLHHAGNKSFQRMSDPNFARSRKGVNHEG